MRVIAGRFGGRRLVAPRGAATRPTADRVREALFSMLGEMEGVRVLDVYAGTGALGIEALSRGAAGVVFVEEARGALFALHADLGALEIGAAAVVHKQAVERAAAGLRPHAPFDLILADPPYAKLLAASAALEALVEDGLLVSGGRLVLEHASRDRPPVIKKLRCVSTRSYGEAALSFYAFETV